MCHLPPLGRIVSHLYVFKIPLFAHMVFFIAEAQADNDKKFYYSLELLTSHIKFPSALNS